MLTLVLPSFMERFRFPRPVGYILAGIILAPNVLDPAQRIGPENVGRAELGW
jgi:Kef-type K+ transport system membrane component KefB